MGVEQRGEEHAEVASEVYYKTKKKRKKVLIFSRHIFIADTYKYQRPFSSRQPAVAGERIENGGCVCPSDFVEEGRERAARERVSLCSCACCAACVMGATSVRLRFFFSAWFETRTLSLRVYFLCFLVLFFYRSWSLLVEIQRGRQIYRSSVEHGF